MQQGEYTHSCRNEACFLGTDPVLSAPLLCWGGGCYFTRSTCQTGIIAKDLIPAPCRQECCLVCSSCHCKWFTMSRWCFKRKRNYLFIIFRVKYGIGQCSQEFLNVSICCLFAVCLSSRCFFPSVPFLSSINPSCSFSVLFPQTIR